MAPSLYLLVLALAACIIAAFPAVNAFPHPVTPAQTDEVLTVGDLRAERGEIARGSVHVNVGTKEPLDIPVILINGKQSGPKVVITAGVHGGEFIGIDAALKLAQALNPEDVRGQIVICPIVNPPAVYGGRVDTSPLDGVNMNRVFPGDATGGPTERLTAWLFNNVIAGADAYADLHSGGIDETLLDFIGYRLTSDKELDEKARAMAFAVGFEHIIYGKNPNGGNSHAAAARIGIPSILIETGYGGDRDSATVRILLDGLYRLLHHLKVLELPETVNQQIPAQREWIWNASVESPATGIWYPQPDAITGSKVAKNQIIGHILDPTDGNEHDVIAKGSGTIMYGLNGLTVELGAELAAIATMEGEADEKES